MIECLYNIKNNAIFITTMSTRSRKQASDDLPSIGNLLEHLDELHLDDGSSEEEKLHEAPAREDMRGVKEVTLHTDVVFGAAGLRGAFHSKKVQYRKGEHLLPAGAALVPQPPALGRTMIIRMPVQEIPQYVESHITTWLPLDDDDLLVQGLHDLLVEQQGPAPARFDNNARYPDVLASPFFHGLDPETQQRIAGGVRQLEQQRRRAKKAAVGDGLLVDKPLIEAVFRPRRARESKAEQKAREKRKRIVELQYLHGEKPEVIARRLDVGLRFVYNTTLFLRNKLQLKKGTPPAHPVLPSDLVPAARARLRDNPDVQAAVREYLAAHGIHRLTLQKVKDFVVARLPRLARMHLNEISQVLKAQHHLRMERLNPATFRYRDPYYDEKRLWFCRLVAQFVLDGALVVSVDETHFRHDAIKRQAWQFHPRAADILKRARRHEVSC